MLTAELLALERAADRDPENYPYRADTNQTIEEYWRWWTPERIERWRRMRR